MTYSYSVNNRKIGVGIDSFPSAILGLKDFLKQNNWTVKASGTFNGRLNLNNFLSSGDLFNNPEEKIDGFGNDICWFVIADPNDNREFLFLKNRCLYINGWLLNNGLAISDNIEENCGLTFIDIPEIYHPSSLTSKSYVEQAKIYVHSVLNYFQFNEYLCKSGFKWYNQSDITIIEDSKVNNILVHYYVKDFLIPTPPASHQSVMQDSNNRPYKIYDGYILNNAKKIGNGFYSDGTSDGSLGATGSGNNALILNGRVVGAITGYHIDTGFEINGSTLTPVSNIDITLAYTTPVIPFIDNDELEQSINGITFVNKWQDFEDCYYSHYTVDTIHGEITLSPQKYNFSKPIGKNTVADPLLGYTINEQNLLNMEINTIYGSCLPSAVYPVGTFEDISGTDNNGVFVPGYIQKFTGVMIISGYLVTTGHVLRDIKYVYDKHIDLDKMVYISNGWVGSGNICHAYSTESNSNLSIAYSANNKFDLVNGIRSNPVSAVNPPLASDMVWLHEKDTNPGQNEIYNNTNTYYANNNTYVVRSLLNPGLPELYYDNDDFINRKPTCYLNSFRTYDVWNYHMCVNQNSPFDFYFMITKRNNISSIIAMDMITSKNIDNTDNVVLINMCDNVGFNFGSSHHNNFMKFWYLDKTSIINRSDFVNSINNNLARFLETGITYQSFYQKPINYTNLETSINQIDLTNSDFTISTSGNYLIIGPINATSIHNLYIQSAITFAQNTTITNGTLHPVQLISIDDINSIGNKSIIIEPNITIDLNHTGRFWIVDKFYSYVKEYNDNVNLTHVNISNENYEMSTVPFEFVITNANTGARFNLMDLPYIGQIVNINNNSGTYIYVYGNSQTVGIPQYNINGKSNNILKYFENASFYFDGLEWKAISYDGRQILPITIDLNSFTFQYSQKNIAKHYVGITLPNEVPAYEQSHYGKLYLDFFPRNGQLVLIENLTNMYQNIYGIKQIPTNIANKNGNIGYKIGNGDGISIAPSESLFLIYNDNNKNWLINKYTATIPSNLSTDISTSTETIVSTTYLRMENSSVSAPLNSMYVGISNFLLMDITNRFDEDLLSDNTSYYITLNLKPTYKPVLNDDTGATIGIQWVGDTNINAD